VSVSEPEPFFASRWVQRPEHVTELPGAGLPEGFRAAGIACGIKPSGAKDLALIVSDAPETTSAARFTSSGVLGAPVLLTMERSDLEHIRAVVINSGNANTATGGMGLDNAAKMQGSAAMATGIGSERAVAVASTGVIGVQLPMRDITRGIASAVHELKADGDLEFAQAIQTTDAFDKRARLQVELPSGTVTLTAQAKGAGMIQPGFATLLVFIQTDAALAPETCDLLLGVTVKRSFERISVDGQLSTSDTVFVLANGAAGVRIEPGSEDEAAFAEAIEALLRALAIQIVSDGEGCKRVGRIVVRGRAELGELVARAVATSPLVKTALHGGDPNFGRILQAAGMVYPSDDGFGVDLEIEGRLVVSGGEAVLGDLRALAPLVAGDEVQYTLTLPGGEDEAEVFFSDLSPEYVRFNAEYTT
jgi:glutamate N-acetyltransferase/amino-acid N-acetyltransferase